MEKLYWLKEYKEIHDLVYIYQSGSKEEVKQASEELLNRFETFLNKYYKLLKFGQCDLSHFSLRSFLKLYISDPTDRAKLNSFFANSKGLKVADDAIYKITHLFDLSTQDDVMHELYIVFFTMCSKYKDTKPSFHHYIKRNFHFYAYRHFDKMCRDMIARNETLPFSTEIKKKYFYNTEPTTLEEMLPDHSNEIELDMLLNEIELFYNLKLSNMPKVKVKSVSVYDNASLNINWINGVTCSPLFLVLTAFERKILVMWYVENKTDSLIADEFGVCRGTINKRRNVAKQKLKNELTKNNIKDLYSWESNEREEY